MAPSGVPLAVAVGGREEGALSQRGTMHLEDPVPSWKGAVACFCSHQGEGTPV